MRYTKPEVEVLGNALAVIEQVNPKDTSTSDGAGGLVISAYDLDE